MKKFILIFILLSILTNILLGRKCFDYQLTDGAEPLLDFGMDTTTNWWAVTEPFDGFKRLIVNGEELSSVRNLTIPTFAQDGYHWACFMEDNSGWILVTQDSSWRVNTDQPGDIVYSSDSKVLMYSYFEGTNMERVHAGEDEFTCFDRDSKIFASQSGTHFAFRTNRNGQITLNINGKTSAVYDQITPIGFMYDDTFLWAASIGGLWHVYRDFEEISETYLFVDNVQINPFGTIAAYSAQLLSNQYTAVIINDDFRDNLETQRFEYISNLILHPFEPIIAYESVFNNNFTVRMNTVSYEAGVQSSIPKFTHDGEDLFFIGCRINCFASVNGRRYPLNNIGFLDKEIAKKPFSETFAFSTNSALVVRDMTKEDLWSGMMVDYTINPRYNRIIDRYETLGVINNRLYLLTCTD